MRLLQRNLVPVWYCLYSGKTVIIDDDGYESGEDSVMYESPVKIMCNVSPATGTAQTEMFGNLESYDKVIVTDDLNCPIDENTVMYIDIEPTEGIPYDYTVKRVAKSLNNISIAVSKVKVSS